MVVFCSIGAPAADYPAPVGTNFTRLWGETHPEFMDALVPLASLPAQIAGRNRAWLHAHAVDQEIRTAAGIR